MSAQRYRRPTQVRGGTALPEVTRRTKVMVSILVGLIVVPFVAGGFSGVGSSDSAPLPPGILGTWSTTAPGYSGSAFTLSEASLSFHRVDGTVEVYSVTGVELVRRDGGSQCKLYYAIGDNAHTFSFFYEELPREIIRLANQKHMVWTKN